MSGETLDAFLPDPDNANLGSEAGQALIEWSLRQLGAGRSVLADKHGVLIAGNKTHEQAVALGLGVQTVHTRGDELVVVVRDDLDLSSDDQRARQLAYADNRTGQLSLTWDSERIAADLAAGLALAPLWSPDDLREFASQPGAGLGDADNAEPDESQGSALAAQYGVAAGQVWDLGPHRLAVGDSRDNALLARLFAGDDQPVHLVWTDPPYGVAYEGKNEYLGKWGKGNHQQAAIGGDAWDDQAGPAAELLAEVLRALVPYTGTGCALYQTAPQGPMLAQFITAWGRTPFVFKQSLVWLKNHFVLGMADYHYRHELVLYGWRDGAHYFTPTPGLDSVFEVRRPSASPDHPTQKPVDLIAPMIANSSRGGQVVCDPFAGSGPVLAACASLGRRARLVEILPEYAGVILGRAASLSLPIRRHDAE